MRRSRSSRRPLFDTLVRSSNALRLFLEFCGVHGGGDVWTSLTMFWLDIEHYRQLVGDADTMACHGLKLWDDYLAAGGDGKGGDGYPTNSRQQHVRSVLPRAELRRLRRGWGAGGARNAPGSFGTGAVRNCRLCSLYIPIVSLHLPQSMISRGKDWKDAGDKKSPFAAP